MASCALLYPSLTAIFKSSRAPLLYAGIGRVVGVAVRTANGLVFKLFERVSVQRGFLQGCVAQLEAPDVALGSVRRGRVERRRGGQLVGKVAARHGDGDQSDAEQGDGVKRRAAQIPAPIFQKPILQLPAAHRRGVADWPGRIVRLLRHERESPRPCLTQRQ